MTKTDFKRLSTSVKPSNYDITIHPNLETFVFTGTETINVEVIAHKTTFFVLLLFSQSIKALYFKLDFGVPYSLY